MKKEVILFVLAMGFQAHLAFADIYGYQSKDDIDKNQMIRDQQTINSLQSWANSNQRDKELKQQKEYQQAQLQLQQQQMMMQQQSMSAQQVYTKYNPSTGKRFPGSYNFDPATGEQLKNLQ